MRRGRPLGLTIALWGCTILYGLYPLAQAIFYLVLSGRRNDSEFLTRALFSLALSVGFLLLMIPAWLGRPPRIRNILTVAVLGLLAVNLFFALLDLVHQGDPFTVNSTTEISRAADYCAFPLYILTTAYILWYLNRHPSRTYYAGPEE